MNLNPMCRVFPIILIALSYFTLNGSSSSTAFGQPQQADPFALGVRDTEPLTPEQQQATFRLPPGFSIQLVTAEPNIAKPMNLAFDTRGRLWVSSSEEYPFAAPPDREPKDTIRILEDTDGDGRADVVTVFADKLNIPIGLYPCRDGVICFSIPNILFLRDTNNDGVCDTREVLYGPFDTTRDTHGMCNAFRRAADGWIYACHGFNNRSEVTGRDGHTVSMQSGNTFRFRADGSRIEHFTIGQVNPFGMAVDLFGDRFTADCHTKPVTLLLQGGNYESFGRPHDGLGYVPNVMEHLHGSTAIGGIALGCDTHFPPEYQDSSFGGNVMTSRINRNQLIHIGSTVRAKEQSDLLSTSDPWFRPVDLVSGPDGALYVADFYNRIIGHYEVDLYHPGRDRHRGRIWRISYDAAAAITAAGEPSKIGNPKPTIAADNSSPDSVATLIEQLRTASAPQARSISDRISDELPDHATLLLKVAATDPSALLRIRSLWLLHRLNAIDETLLAQAAEADDELVRIHVNRIVNETPADGPLSRKFVSALLSRSFADPSAMVRRVAVQSSSRHQNQEFVPLLMRLLQETPSDDLHLRYVTRMALRDHFRNEDWFRSVAVGADDQERVLLADLCLALRTPAAGELIAGQIPLLSIATPERVPEYLQFAAGFVSQESAANVAAAVRKQFAGDTQKQLQLLDSMRTGFELRGTPAPDTIAEWAQSLALQLLEMKSVDDLTALSVPKTLWWNELPHSDSPSANDCWTISVTRKSSDGMQTTPLFSSFENGEQRTGILRSEAFELADEFRFFLAGHDGFPDKPLKNRNLVRLIDVETGMVLRQASPPRNDTAQPVIWSTTTWANRRARIELVDGDSDSAYAWLAAGRFSDNRLNPDRGEEPRQQAALLIGGFHLTSLKPALETLLRSQNLQRSSQTTLAGALVRLQPDSVLAATAMIPGISGTSTDLVQSALQSVLDRNVVHASETLSTACLSASSAEQLRLAEVLAGDLSGASTLVSLVEQGRTSARILLRPTISQRLAAIGNDALKQRVVALTANLPAEDASVERLINERRRSFRQQNGTASVGQELFRKHCLICHQVAAEGKKVGPNLDGIGNRGLDRVAEDVLAPNRNVDVAFRTTTLVTTDGRAISGLLRELESGQLSLIDSQGKETLVAAADIDERIPSALSPMPANVAELLTEEQFRDLVAYLMSLKH